jgi:hypothetical protein
MVNPPVNKTGSNTGRNVRLVKNILGEEYETDEECFVSKPASCDERRRGLRGGAGTKWFQFIGGSRFRSTGESSAKGNSVP